MTHCHLYRHVAPPDGAGGADAARTVTLVLGRVYLAPNARLRAFAGASHRGTPLFDSVDEVRERGGKRTPPSATCGTRALD